MPSRKSLAIATALVAVVTGSATAHAASTRADYAAQVNPICASATAQDQQLTARSEEELRRIHQALKKVEGRKREKLLARDRKLSSALPDQHLRIRYSELARLRAVPAAPGDEGLVATWLDGRKQSLDLTSKVNSIDRRVERLFKRFRTRDIDELNRLDRKVRVLDKRAAQINNQVFDLETQNDELGTQLGATDCVTDIS
jgi:hypothetical protein